MKEGLLEFRRKKGKENVSGRRGGGRAQVCSRERTHGKIWGGERHGPDLDRVRPHWVQVYLMKVRT